MSDSNYKSIQDRGWNQMRSVLDNELPENKRKRPIVLWFLFGSAAIAFVAFLGLTVLPILKAQPANADNVKRKDNATAVFSNDESVETMNEIDPSERGFADSKPKVNNALKNRTESKSLDLAKNPGNSKKSSFANNNSTKKTIFDNSALPNIDRSEIIDSGKVLEIMEKQNPSTSTQFIDNQTTRSNQSSQLDLKINAAESNKHIPTSENTIPKRSILQPLFKIPTFLPPFLITDKIKPFEANPEILKNGKNYFSSYIFAASNYQTQYNGFSYGAGAGLNYGNDDFGIYLEGLYFKSIYNNGTTTEELVEDAKLNEIEGADSGVITNTPEYNLNVSTFSKLTSSTDEVRIGMGIRKRVSNRFKIDLGLAYSRLLKADNQSLILIVNDPILEFAPESYSVNRTELYDSGAYSNYDVIPHLGLEFSLSSKLFLNLHYNFGLKNLIADTEVERLSSTSVDDAIYRRNVGIKIRYEF